MLKEYLPQKIFNAIEKEYSFSDICEIRMRVDVPIVLDIYGQKFALKDEVVCSRHDLETFIYKICDNSLYLMNDSLSKGFITLAGGIRVGIAGEIVSENGVVKTIKNFQSANIRIPHEVKNCSIFAFDFLHDNEMKNTLIISPPGAGKTTFLRDIVRQIDALMPATNVLVADERSEIASTVDGVPQIWLGNNVDVFSACSKEFAFTYGIRSMNPNIFVTDEIDLKSDIATIISAINSGVKVIATIHAKGVEDLKNKPGFEEVMTRKIFERYVVLTKDDRPGCLAYIFDEKLHCLFCR